MTLEERREWAVGDVVAFRSDHKWHGCVAIVYEPKPPWGACVEIKIPGGTYPIRTKNEDLVYIGKLP